eukprot:g8131.t1
MHGKALGTACRTAWLCGVMQDGNAEVASSGAASNGPAKRRKTDAKSIGSGRGAQKKKEQKYIVIEHDRSGKMNNKMNHVGPTMGDTSEFPEVFTEIEPWVRRHYQLFRERHALVDLTSLSAQFLEAIRPSAQQLMPRKQAVPQRTKDTKPKRRRAVDKEQKQRDGVGLRAEAEDEDEEPCEIYPPQLSTPQDRLDPSVGLPPVEKLRSMIAEDWPPAKMVDFCVEFAEQIDGPEARLATEFLKAVPMLTKELADAFRKAVASARRGAVHDLLRLWIKTEDEAFSAVQTSASEQTWGKTDGIHADAPTEISRREEPADLVRRDRYHSHAHEERRRKCGQRELIAESETSVKPTLEQESRTRTPRGNVDGIRKRPLQDVIVLDSSSDDEAAKPPLVVDIVSDDAEQEAQPGQPASRSLITTKRGRFSQAALPSRGDARFRAGGDFKQYQAQFVQKVHGWLDAFVDAKKRNAATAAETENERAPQQAAESRTRKTGSYEFIGASALSDSSEISSDVCSAADLVESCEDLTGGRKVDNNEGTAGVAGHARGDKESLVGLSAATGWTRNDDKDQEYDPGSHPFNNIGAASNGAASLSDLACDALKVLRTVAPHVSDPDPVRLPQTHGLEEILPHFADAEEGAQLADLSCPQRVGVFLNGLAGSQEVQQDHRETRPVGASRSPLGSAGMLPTMAKNSEPMPAARQIPPREALSFADEVAGFAAWGASAWEL